MAVYAQSEMSCVPEEEHRKKYGRTKCLLCNKPYCTPKLLDCFHTFCVYCLHSVDEFWTPLLEGSTHARRIPCPQCQSLSDVPEGGVNNFRDNDYVAGISEDELSELQSSSGSNQPVFCLVCDNRTPVHSACVECRLLLCRHCQYFHGKFEGSKEHTLHELDIEETADLGAGDSAQSWTSGSDGFFTVNNHSIATSMHDDADSVNVPSASSTLKAGTQPPSQPPPQQSPAFPNAPPLPPRQYDRSDFHRISSSSAIGATSAHYNVPKLSPLEAAAERESDDDDDEDYNEIDFISGSSSDDGAFARDFCRHRRSVPPSPGGNHCAKTERPLSLFAPRLPSSKALLPKAKKWPMKWPDANVRSISFSSKSVVLLGTAAQKRTKLGVFNYDGTKVSKVRMPDIRTMAVLDDFSKTLLLLSEEGQPLRWSPIQRPQDFTTIQHISLDGMLLSKSVPGDPVYVVGSNEGCLQIQKVQVERSTPRYLLDHKGDIHKKHFCVSVRRTKR